MKKKERQITIVGGTYPAAHDAIHADLTLSPEEMAELLNPPKKPELMPMWTRENIQTGATAPATWSEVSQAISDCNMADGHPLLQYVTLDGVPKPPNWVVPGLIAEGLVTISGQQGVGKTTALFPLAMIAAGLIDSELSPGDCCWREVIYVTEDSTQVQRIAAGLVRAGLVDPVLLAERVHVSQAVRMPSGQLVLAGDRIVAANARHVDGFGLLPLIVLDTKSACLDSDDENSNAETSRTVADLKQRFNGLPVWIVGHVSKSNFGRSDVDGMSSRGASALEADAHQTVFLVRDGDERWLVNGKTRFEARHRELRIDSHVETITVKNRFGHDETLALRFGIPRIPDIPRAEQAAAAKADAKAQAHADLREQVLDTLRATQANGDRLNQTSLRERVGRRAADVTAVTNELLNERWLIEVDIPAHLRSHPKRNKFLYALTSEQHDRVTLDGQQMPPEAKEIPTEWLVNRSRTESE